MRRPAIVELETRESPLVEADETPPVKRLDGKVTKKGELPFAGGTYCEVWMGLWDKCGEEAEREKGDLEKVCPSFTNPILLTLPLQVALKALRVPKSSAKARKVCPHESSPRCLLMFPSTIIRDLKVNCQGGRSCIIKTSYRSMVCIFQTLPLEGSHGCIGIITNLGTRLYMVSGLPGPRKHEAKSSSLGVTMAGTWKPAWLRQKDPWSKQELYGGLHHESPGKGPHA